MSTVEIQVGDKVRVKDPAGATPDYWERFMGSNIGRVYQVGTRRNPEFINVRLGKGARAIDYTCRPGEWERVA